MQVKRDRWQGPAGEDVAIEIYYHPGHEYNVDRMIDAVKKSLTYFTANFGPYQHRQVRILEFPRYASFAQSFPNTIPYSESIGFIARVEKDEDVDYPFYVTAHEVAHQWWAHQVIGGNVQGATVLSETLSQYSALHGDGARVRTRPDEEVPEVRARQLPRPAAPSNGRRSCRCSRSRTSRTSTTARARWRCTRCAITSARTQLNGALAKFLADKKYQQPPYTTSRELLSYLRAATPAVAAVRARRSVRAHHALRQPRDRAPATRAPPDGKYRVAINVEAKKFRADDRATRARCR